MMSNKTNKKEITMKTNMNKSFCFGDAKDYAGDKPKQIKRKTNRLTRKSIRELIKKKKKRGLVWEC